MAPADTTASSRPARWGLGAKLFAILLLLGAVAVLVTAVLGYLRARDALEASIYNQLTTGRKSKARQVETYFRTIRNELSQLATAKMTIDAAREFRAGFDELERSDVPFEVRRKVGDWYEMDFLREMRRVLGKELNINDYLPVGPAAYYLQYHYIVANPHPKSQRKLVDDAGDGSAYSKQHAIYHPLLRGAATAFGFFDLMLADPRSGRLIYAVDKEVDFATSLRIGPHRHSNVSAAVARCAAADRSAVCFEDFAPYAPSRGAPTAFMTTPVIDQGVVIAVLIAQLSIEEIDNVATGDRNWRHDGFGDTGEAYLVGPDRFVRSGPRAFYENPAQYFAALKGGGESDENVDAIRRYGTPVMHQRVVTEAARAALAGVEGAGEILGYRGIPTLASWGPLAIPGTKWALIAKVDTSEALAPIYKLQRDLMIVGGLALLVVIVTGAWLSRSLLGPLRELTAGVTRFAAGDYGAKVPVRTRDEIGALCTAFNGMVEELRDKSVVIENKNRENEELLLNVLPAPIANRLRGGEQGIADGFAEVTVAFADIVGFTAMSSDMPPADVVSLLNGLFTRFDDAAHELGIEKIKTVGDAYMAVCGLPVQVPDHAERMVRMAIRMVHITREHAMEHHVEMKLRVGINSGPVVAGVIGKSKYIYDLWGDTVNLASRMESGGMPDTIQVTRSVYEKLKDEFVFEARGTIEVKGKGGVEAWLLKL
jgi:class 3 adenylate cyclase